MHDEVQITSVRHHPWESISISVHRQKEGKIRCYEWGTDDEITSRRASSRIIHRKGTERRVVTTKAHVAVGNFEVLYESLAKGFCELRGVRVVSAGGRIMRTPSTVVRSVPSTGRGIRVEEDVNVKRLESPGSWLTCAVRPFYVLRVRIHQDEEGE